MWCSFHGILMKQSSFSKGTKTTLLAAHWSLTMELNKPWVSPWAWRNEFCCGKMGMRKKAWWTSPHVQPWPPGSQGWAGDLPSLAIVKMKKKKKKGKKRSFWTWILELVLLGFFLHFFLQPTSQCLHSPPSCRAAGSPGLAQQVLTHSRPPFVSPGSSQVPELFKWLDLAYVLMSGSC